MSSNGDYLFRVNWKVVAFVLALYAGLVGVLYILGGVIGGH